MFFAIQSGIPYCAKENMHRSCRYGFKQIPNRVVEYLVGFQTAGNGHGALQGCQDMGGFPAPCFRRHGLRQGGGDPVDVGLKECGHGSRKFFRQAGAFGAQHAAQANAVRPFERLTVNRAERRQMIGRRFGVCRLGGERCENARGVSLHNREAQVFLLAEIVMNAGTFDSQLIRKLAKAHRMIAA